jgi:hypothetical protein
MSQTIKLKYDNTDYLLEFTRASITTMEKNGFSIQDLQSKPATCVIQLFSGAFIAHHRSVRQSDTEKIFNALTNKEKLLLKLVEMYNEPLMSLFEDGEEDPGNATWEEG